MGKKRAARPGLASTSSIELLQRMLEEDMELLRSGLGHDGKKLSQTQYRILRKAVEARALRLGELTGETLLIDERKVARMPAFIRLCEVVKNALKPWPDAMVAVAEALQRVERGEAQAAP